MSINSTNNQDLLKTQAPSTPTAMTVQPHSFYNYAQASVAGAARGLFALPIEHPWDTIKTRMQANQTANQSVFTVAREIIKKEGVRGFYKGATPNAFRLGSKQAFRYPLMLWVPSVFEKNIPMYLKENYPPVVQIATGLTIAGLEAGFICFPERLKVYLMTKDDVKTGKITSYLKQHKGQMWKEATRGLNAVCARQSVSWVSFLVADKYFKDLERKRTKTKELSFGSLLGVSCMVGSVNTLTNMPFDVLKTQLQRENFMQNKGIIKSMHHIYQKHGVKGLYAGWKVRMVQYMIQSVFTVTLLEKLETSFRKNNQATQINN